MSALARSSTSTDLAPTTAPPATASAGPAVAQATGNAAAQERAGTQAPPPAPASGLDAAMDALGETAAVVLDALPLPMALPLALARRAEPWVARWLHGQDEQAVYTAAKRTVATAFDLIWPVGLGVRLDGLLSGAVVSGVEACASASAEREAAGLRVRLSGSVAREGGLGHGLKVAGAEGASLGVLGVGAAGKGTIPVEAEWLLDASELLGALVVERKGSIYPFLLGTASLETTVLPFASLLRGLAPTSVRVGIDLGGKLQGNAIGGPVGAEGSVEGSAGGGVGADGEGAFVDVHLGTSGRVRGTAWFLSALAMFGLPDEFALAFGGDLRVRLRGTSEAIQERDLTALSFEVTSTYVENERTVVDTFRFEDVRSLVAWLITLTNPIVDLVFTEGPPVAAEALPERTLTRSVTREIPSADEFLEIAPSMAGNVPTLLKRLTDRIDRLGDGLPVDVDYDARVEGTVAVPTEAVRAAIGYESLTPGPDGVEAAVLEVAGAVASYVASGTMFEFPDLRLDLDSAAEEVDFRNLELVVSVDGDAGLGVDLSQYLEVSGEFNVGAEIYQRIPLTSLDGEERRALLAGGPR